MRGEGSSGQAAVLNTSSEGGAIRDPVLDRVRSGEIIPLGSGQVGLAGGALRLFRGFSRTFAGLARQWGASERLYPSLIPAAVLGRGDYFSSFPQHVTFVSHLAEGSEDIVRFAGQVEQGNDPAQAARPLLCLPLNVLSSAVCYHCYEEFAGRRVPAPGVLITAEERCFRFEGHGMRALARQWEFTMREVVFIGPARDASDWREMVLRRTVELTRELGLDGRVEPASDPFFSSSRGRSRAVFQEALDLKYELRLATGPVGETLAAASFNLHQDYFGRAFDIKLADGTVAWSACVAFGIERWVYASLGQRQGNVSFPPEVRE